MKAEAKQKCARCHRPFTPKKEGQRFGPNCARKVAAEEHQNAIDEIGSAYWYNQLSYEKPDPNER